MNPAAVSIQDAEAVRAYFSDFVAFWQVPERTHDQPAHSVEFVVGEFAVKELVEVLDRGQCLDQEVTAGQRLDIAVFLDIVFVFDIADDLLQNVLNRHQARHAAVFVDDDGHVVMVGAELAQ